MQYISSTQNQRIKELVKLTLSKKDRSLSGLFVLESVKLIVDASVSGAEITSIFVTEHALAKHCELLEPLLEACGDSFTIAEEVADKISTAVTSQGVFALCRLPTTKPPAIEKSGRYLLLEQVQDPGNVGTIIRSAAAFGIDGLILTANCADVFSPKVLRSAMGGVFHLPISVVENLPDFIGEMRAAGLSVYAAALDKTAVTADKLNFAHGGAVVIGNEGNGLAEATIAACTMSTIIPIAPNTESLNAGVAASVFLWEMSKTKA